jgi:hypothetical protein
MDYIQKQVRGLKEMGPLKNKRGRAITDPAFGL